MPNRILKDSICTSPNIDVLSRSAEVFFYRLLVQCDDFGRMDARTPILRAKCYPLQYEKATTADIDAWLNELQASKLVAVYDVDGLPYLQMLTWEKHQQVRAQRSKYPPLPESDSNCNQMKSNDCNGLLIQSNPIRIQSESNPIAHAHEATEAQDKPNKNGVVIPDGYGMNGHTKPEAQVTVEGMTQEAKRLGVNAEQFRLMVDELLAVAGWTSLVDNDPDSNKHARAKRQALVLIRMGHVELAQFRALIESFKAANDWRKSPPVPETIVEYASQVKDGVAAKASASDKLSHEQRDKLQADLKATQNRIRTAERLGSVAAQRDIDLMASIQQRLGGAM